MTAKPRPRLYYQFRIHLEIQNRSQLRKEAESRYIEENWDHHSAWAYPELRKKLRAEWKSLRATNLDPIAADLHMLLDPGSVAGASIAESVAEDETP